MEEELLIETPPTPGPFFRFADENAWLTAARAAGFTANVPVYDEEGNETGTEEKVIQYTHNYALDVVGSITVGGEWDEDGNVITEPTVLDGWHINYRGEVPDEWLQYAVSPEQPVRVWA